MASFDLSVHCTLFLMKENQKTIASTSSSDQGTGDHQHRKIDRLICWRDLALPIVEELFPARTYFKIDFELGLHHEEGLISEAACSIKMLKNLFYAVMQQRNEVAQFDDIEKTPCLHPIETEATTICGRTIGIAACQGHRSTMEDTHLAFELDLEVDQQVHKAEVYAVFDGHGGSAASEFLKSNFEKYLKWVFHNRIGKKVTEEGVFKSLKECFITLNRVYKKIQGRGGSTAVVVLILNGMIYIANVGDSRAILLTNSRVIQLSEDAKPGIDRYRKKVIQLGGRVVFKEDAYRVDGVVATARAIGDFYDSLGFSIFGVSPNPKISCFPISEIKDGLLVLSCDGPFEVELTTNHFGEYLLKEMRSSPSMSELAQRAVKRSLDAGSLDNLTVMTIPINPLMG